MLQPHVINRPRKNMAARLWANLKRYKWLYIMLIPAVLYYGLFKLWPTLRLDIVVQRYSPQMENLGIQSPSLDPWYKNFQVFFSHRDFPMLLRNTLTLAVLNILFYFPFPILLALLLNEVRHSGYKRTVQSVLYLPHFVSWMVLGSLMLMLLGPAPNGLVNNLLTMAGKADIPFMTSEQWFRPMYIIELIWKEAGWGTIIYLAALSGVDEQLYEAAVIDGAGRFKQLIHITLPSIKSTIVVMLILRMGSFLENGFDQIYLMLNSLNYNVATVFDTYIYDVGLLAKSVPVGIKSSYSYSAAVGLFRSIVSLILVLCSNALAKLFGEEGVY